jgi:large conductance mechanosensitive channel
MRGFKDFVMRGNLVEIAVAFIIAGAFKSVVDAFTALLIDILGKIGGQPNFSSWNPGGVSVGVFITTVISFVILAAVVYFFVVKPYEAAKAHFDKPAEDEATPDENLELLKEIRDAIRARGV